MLKLLLCGVLILSAVTAADAIDTVNLLETGTYTWDSSTSDLTSLIVTAEGYCILVTIDECNIGIHNDRPNEQYLVLRQGNDDSISSDVGKLFAYITTSKKLYFYSSAVLLELKTNTALTEKCRVTFEKSDEQETTLPPVTTTESGITVSPGTSKYSTVYMSGHNIDDFSDEKDLLLTLKECLVKMATNYTTMEGFCLQEEITTNDVELYVLEQCSTSWPNYETCVRLMYAIPVTMNQKCSLWSGYQLTEEHLNIMWLRIADDYLTSGFQVYLEPSVDSVVTWWIVCIICVIIGFTVVMIFMNLCWKRREMSRSKLTNDMDEFATDTKRVSDVSMSLPDYQSTPPMFEGTYTTGETYFEGKFGTDNEGFQRNDEILTYEEET